MSGARKRFAGYSDREPKAKPWRRKAGFRQGLMRFAARPGSPPLFVVPLAIVPLEPSLPWWVRND
jgi:hypothetical protein